MSVAPSQSRYGRDTQSEDRVDVRRYLDALRRSRSLILLIVLVVTGVVVGLSLALPDTYKATARLVFEVAASPFGETDEASVERRLETTERLLTTADVLRAAASQVPGESESSIEDKVESAVDQDANIISITGSDGGPRTAAAIANAVADAFLTEREEFERDRISRAREALEAQILLLETAPNAEVQIGAIRERISELSVSEGSAGSDLQVAERAEPPSAPASPRPLRNGVLALFGSLFLGVLVVLGRDQLTPRVTSTRELGRLLDIPVLTGIPFVGGRRGRRRRVLSGVELEAYQTLRSSLELSLRSDRRQHVVLITGALHAEGKTTAAARLARSLAQSGHRTLVVSADLRVPRLHEMFGIPLGVGLSDILAVLDWDTATFDDGLFERATHVAVAAGQGKGRRGELHVITSGTKAKDPGRLIAGPAMTAFLEHVRGLDYEYVLLDAPPLLGIADSQALAREVDEILLVSRLDRLTLEHVAELRDVIDRLDLRPLGIVVIGARGEISPYYLTRRPLIEEEQPST